MSLWNCLRKKEANGNNCILVNNSMLMTNLLESQEIQAKVSSGILDQSLFKRVPLKILICITEEVLLAQSKLDLDPYLMESRVYPIPLPSLSLRAHL